MIRLLALGLLIAASAHAEDWKKSFKVDSLHQTAPPLTFVDEKGAPHRLSDYRGSRVLLHLWATWCDTCMTEMPKFSELVAGTSGAPALLLVSIDDAAKKKEVLDFVKKLPGSPGAYRVRKEQSDSDFWGWGVPVTYFIDENGTVTARVLGSRDWSTVAAADRAKFLTSLFSK